MAYKDLLNIVIGSIIVAVLLSIFSASQGFFFSPQFEINASNVQNSTKLLLKNVGSAQAKNVQAFIDHSNDIELTSKNCPEGKVTPSDNYKLEVSFSKMSVNIECTLFFEGLVIAGFNVVLVADDIPGKNWNNLDQEEKYYFVLVILPLINNFVIALAVGTSILFIAVSLNRRKRNKSYKKLEQELSDEQKILQQELRFLQNRPKEGRSLAHIAEEENQEQILQEKVTELSDQIDELKTKILTDAKTGKLVGSFFMSWALLERELNRLGTEYEIGTVLIRSQSGLVVKRLFEREIITKSTMDKFHDIRRFRNNLAHGLTAPSAKELQVHIVALKELREIFQDIGKIKGK